MTLPIMTDWTDKLQDLPDLLSATKKSISLLSTGNNLSLISALDNLPI